MGKKETRNRHYYKKRRYLVKNKTYRGGEGTPPLAPADPNPLPAEPLVTQVPLADPNAVVEDSNAVVEDPNAVVEDPNAVVEDPNAVIADPNAVVEDPNAVAVEPIVTPVPQDDANMATAQAAAELGISNPPKQQTFTAAAENVNADNVDITQPVNNQKENQLNVNELAPKFMGIMTDMYKWLPAEDKKKLIEELTKTVNDDAVQTNIQTFAETGLLFMQTLLMGPLALGAAVAAGGSRKYKKRRRSKRTRSNKQSNK